MEGWRDGGMGGWRDVRVKNLVEHINKVNDLKC